MWASCLYRNRYMPIDFLTLLRRDHGDLQQELSRLLDPSATVAQLVGSLDGVRLGLTAHAEAQAIVLARFELVPELQAVIAQAGAAHSVQERALSSLVTARPGTISWRDRAFHLRELVRRDAEEEETTLMLALRRHAPVNDYTKLAGAFATERLRQLAMLQPSAPVWSPYALAGAM
jgi:hypothetical protein